MTYTFDLVPTPLGDAIAVFSKTSKGKHQLVSFTLTAKELPAPLSALPQLSATLGEPLEHLPGVADKVAAAVDRYFAGEDVAFAEAIDFDLSRLEPLTARVVQFTLGTTRGEFVTYGEVAASLGMPRAGRAIGSACRRSPFSIVVPFQRIVRADGKPSSDADMAQRHAYLQQLEQQSSAIGEV